MIDIKIRTKTFAINMIKACRKIKYTDINSILIKQLVRSTTSVGANVRAYSRARSKNEAYSKLCIVVEEADEVVYWLELLIEIDGEFAEIANMYDEAEQILKIMNSIKSKLKDEI